MYGVSGVMIGKICRKLKIPLPGRGYWAKKEFGKPVERMPFLEEKDLPVLMRHAFPAAEQANIKAAFLVPSSIQDSIVVGFNDNLAALVLVIALLCSWPFDF